MRFALVTLFAMASLSWAEPTDYAKLLKAAKGTLSDAIDQATKEVKDSVAVDSEIEDEDGHTQWSIVVAQGSKLLEVNIDATNNQLLGKPGTEKGDDSELVKAVKISLKQAIAAAIEKVKGSKAVDAAFQKDGDKVTASVVVFADGKVSTVTVDAVTGKVSKVEEGQKEEAPEKDGDNSGK